MRKIFLTEEQNNLFRAKQAPIVKSVKERVSDGDIYVPLSNPEYAEKLITKAYADSISHFNDDITLIELDRVRNEFNRLLGVCIRKEKNIRPELEKLCYNLIVENFEIPEDTISFDLNLKDSIDNTHSFHITPGTDEERTYDSVDAINIESKEVEKRKLINMLTQGITDDITSDLMHKATSELFDLDEELPHIYSKLVKLNNYLLFNTDIEIDDNNPSQGGYVETLLGNDLRPSMIKTTALTFPFLLSETIKGVMEVVTANGLPQDTEEAKLIVDKSDCLKQEPWNMRMGREFWKNLIRDNELPVNLIPDFLDYIVKADADSFIGFIDEVVHSTKKAAKIVKNIADAVKHEREYREFSDRIMQRDDEKPLITDEEFLY